MNIPRDINMVRFTRLPASQEFHCDMWDDKHNWYTGRDVSPDAALAKALDRKVQRARPVQLVRADIAGIELDL